MTREELEATTLLPKELVFCEHERPRRACGPCLVAMARAHGHSEAAALAMIQRPPSTATTWRTHA